MYPLTSKHSNSPCTQTLSAQRKKNDSLPAQYKRRFTNHSPQIVLPDEPDTQSNAVINFDDFKSQCMEGEQEEHHTYPQ